MRKANFFLFSFLFLMTAACGPAGEPADQESAEAGTQTYPTTGSIDRYSLRLDSIIPPGAVIEVLASGFDWSEGPLWLPGQDILIFSDIPPNRIYSWREGDTTATLYLEPSGYTGDEPRGGEPGANGLLLDSQGRLVLCQHGDRRIARMEAPINDPKPQFTTLAGKYDGKRFNSPNDAVFDSRGNLYFTDPPYGLVGNMDDPAKEIAFQGVYRLSPDGELTLLTDGLSRPNGIALSPDETRLYVANSDGRNPIWMAFDLTPDGKVENGRVFADAAPKRDLGPGGPDGMKVNRQGIIFATGPGGVWIMSPEGEHLGTILTGQATANCALNAAEDALYMTADSLLLRVKLR